MYDPPQTRPDSYHRASTLIYLVIWVFNTPMRIRELECFSNSGSQQGMCNQTCQPQRRKMSRILKFGDFWSNGSMIEAGEAGANISHISLKFCGDS